MLKIYKLLSKNINEKDTEREELLALNTVILESLEEEVDSKIHQTQVNTAKKIFKRFVKIPQTTDTEVQVNVDEMMKNLTGVIHDKEIKVGMLNN